MGTPAPRRAPQAGALQIPQQSRIGVLDEGWIQAGEFEPLRQQYGGAGMWARDRRHIRHRQADVLQDAIPFRGPELRQVARRAQGLTPGGHAFARCSCKPGV
jgi:hypothetical protein